MPAKYLFFQFPMGDFIHQISDVAVPALRLIAEVLSLEVLKGEVINLLALHPLLPLLGNLRPYAALVGIHERPDLKVPLIGLVQEQLDI